MPPVPPQSVCPGCGHPVDATGTCTRCGARYTSLRVVRKQPLRGRGATNLGRKRRLTHPWRVLVVLLVGVLFGIPIGYALPHGQPSPPVEAASAAPAAPTPQPTPSPSVTPKASPSRAPSLRPADAPVAQPWHPAARPTQVAPGQPRASAPLKSSSSPRPRASTRPANRTYVVQPGDTFAGIAQKLYGAPSLASTLVRANPGIDPRALPLGRAIVVPPAPPSSRPTPAATRPGGPRAVASAAPGPRPRPPRQAP